MRAAYALCAAALSLTAAVASARPPAPKPGQVYSFHGLRELEQDPKVSDAEKEREWAAFVARARAQLKYAEQAAARWRDADKLRRLEAAEHAETDASSNPEERLARWAAVLKAPPSEAALRRARAREAHWRAAETARRVAEAERVEGQGAAKIDRVRTWQWVLAWAPNQPKARARVRALQARLFEEARAIDAIPRVARATKIAAWRDVLSGAPTAAQKKAAQSRLRALGAPR